MCFQLRKLDKERLAFISEKKNISIKRERLIEALKKEKIQLQERLNAISVGPHAQRELKVRTDHCIHVLFEISGNYLLVNLPKISFHSQFRPSVKYAIY